MSEQIEFCAGCEHGLNLHYKDVKDVVRCLSVDRGVSDRGVIGIPYEHHCDCADYESEQGYWRRTNTEREKQKRDELVARMVETVTEKFDKLRANGGQCAERLDAVPFTSDHRFETDFHCNPRGRCLKCGLPIAEWAERCAARSAEILKQNAI